MFYFTPAFPSTVKSDCLKFYGKIFLAIIHVCNSNINRPTLTMGSVAISSRASASDSVFRTPMLVCSPLVAKVKQRAINNQFADVAQAF
jgi:hypothetical protein